MTMGLRAQALQAAVYYARTQMGRTGAVAEGAIPDPVIPNVWLVLVRDGAEAWAMLVEKGEVTMDSLDVEDYERAAAE